jgi:hypothetical protein
VLKGLVDPVDIASLRVPRPGGFADQGRRSPNS